VRAPRPLFDAREVAAIALTCATNAVVHRVLPHETHIAANLLAAAGVVGLAASAGASLDDLGLRPEEIGPGAKLGAAVAGTIAGGVLVGALVPRTRAFFADERVSEVGHGRAAYELALRIPLGTALAEELLFRSGLTALFARRRSWPVAMLMSNAVFGLWHVLPTTASLDTSAASERIGEHRDRGVAAVAGVVAATAAGGVGFSALMRRARSVSAPVLVHAVLNGTTYTASRLLALLT
jgi:membrane protease YdiL (CAAX protease family)